MCGHTYARSDQISLSYMYYMSMGVLKSYLIAATSHPLPIRKGVVEEVQLDAHNGDAMFFPSFGMRNQPLPGLWAWFDNRHRFIFLNKRICLFCTFGVYHPSKLYKNKILVEKNCHPDQK